MPGGTASVELSVIVPCYNEEGNLPELVERTERVFERRRIRGELVLVDDGSRDGTAAQIEALAARHPCVVGVHHPTNLGIPAGWRSGFERSSGRYVCTIDADLQYQPEAIALLYREMCFSKADLVQGWRSTLERQHDHRYYWSRGLDYILKLAFAMPEYDVKSGFVLYRREVFEDILREAGRFHYFQHMITVVAKSKGYSIRQVETLFAERHAGQSFIGGFPLRMMSRTFVDIGRAFAAYRLREPKDQALEAVVGRGGNPATGPVDALAAWVRDPAISRNGPRYLDELRRTQWLPRAQIEELQLQRLRRLLVHAADHVGYWRELFQATGLVPDDVRTLADLRRVPSLTKSALRENIYFDLVSDSSTKRKIAKVTTSGNSGEPLAVFIDRLQRDTRWANAMRHREWAGWRPGEASLRIGSRVLAPAGPVPVRERLHAALARPDTLTGSAIDRAVVEQLAERLRRQRPGVLEADAEVLRALTSLGAGGDAPPVRAAVATGQTLGDELRTLVQDRLGARVFGRYGAREFGPVAQECEAGGWHVNAESFVVEIECDGRPAADGERGDVLVTDLTNYCVPLLRYRLGDVAAVSASRCPCGRGLPLLEGVAGRPEAALLVAGGRWVPSSVFADLLGQYEFAVQRWQVVQPARDRVVVRLVRKSRLGPPTEDAIRRALGEALGGGAVLELIVVDALPADGTRPVVPLPADAVAAPREAAR